MFLPLTLIIILIIFTFDLTLASLNYKNRNQTIPENVADVYKDADYRKWIQYTMETHRLSVVSKILNTVVLILFLIFGVFPKIADAVAIFTSDLILQTLLFLGLYMFITFSLNIGFNVYRTFSIEARYGFNKSTPTTFLIDQLKFILLTTAIGGLVFYCLLYLYLKMNAGFILYAWLFITLLMLSVNLLYTKVFIRFFNKLTPLPEGDLYEKIKILANDTGYKIKEISIIDASRRSARLNAFFSGFGKFKHIVLYDTLIEKCSVDEILSVLAHEIGHAKHKDVLRNFFISIVQISVYLALLSFFLSSVALAEAFGFTEIHLGFAIILFSILMQPFGIILSIPLSILSRKAEYAADAYAYEVGYQNAMISALKVLARENFSNLTPHPLVVKLTYSHPPVSQRIEALSK